MSYAVSLILLLSLLAGCSHWFSGNSPPPELPLLSPADYFLQNNSASTSQGGLSDSIQYSQRVNVVFEGERQTLLAVWTVSDEQFVFVGLTPTGQRLLTLTYDGKELIEDFSPLMTKTFPAHDVVAQLQLAHWPSQSIYAGYHASDWVPKVTAGCRQLYLKKRLVLSVSITDEGGCGEGMEVASQTKQLSDVVVRHHFVDFQLYVTSLDDN